MKNKIDKFIDKEINEFINWYNRNNKTIFLSEYSSEKLINFIEKMAVWYELRYPNYEVNRIIKGIDEIKNVNDEMFYKNEYMQGYLNNYNNEINLNWPDFYNTEVFINSLPTEETVLLEDYRYKDLIYININGVEAHLHLNPNGTIDESERMGVATRCRVSDNELNGIHIKDLIKLFKKLNIRLSEDNILENLIIIDEKKKYFKEKLLNTVMYRIIARGKDEVGVRRAILFAKEFNLSLPLSMWVALDSNSILIGEYLKYNTEEQKQLKLKK